MPLILNDVPQLPADPTAAVEELKKVVQEQHQALLTISASLFSVAYAAPQRPRTGMIRFADGTEWDPGAGEGLYEYRGGTWNKL